MHLKHIHNPIQRHESKIYNRLDFVPIAIVELEISREPRSAITAPTTLEAWRERKAFSSTKMEQVVTGENTMISGRGEMFVKWARDVMRDPRAQLHLTRS